MIITVITCIQHGAYVLTLGYLILAHLHFPFLISTVRQEINFKNIRTKKKQAESYLLTDN